RLLRLLPRPAVAGGVARADGRQGGEAVLARRAVARAGRAGRGPPARHGRRAALPRAVRGGERRRRRHHTSATRRARSREGRGDVRQAGRARPGRRREHGLGAVRVRPALVPVRPRRRRVARWASPCAAPRRGAVRGRRRHGRGCGRSAGRGTPRGRDGPGVPCDRGARRARDRRAARGGGGSTMRAYATVPPRAPLPRGADITGASSPPLALPGSHFVAALLFWTLGAAGLVWISPELAQGMFPLPRVVAVTHLFTLGW